MLMFVGSSSFTSLSSATVDRTGPDRTERGWESGVDLGSSLAMMRVLAVTASAVRQGDMRSTWWQSAASTSASRPCANRGDGYGGDEATTGERRSREEDEDDDGDRDVAPGTRCRGTSCVAADRRSDGRLVGPTDTTKGEAISVTGELAGEASSEARDVPDERTRSPARAPSCVLRCCFMLSLRANRLRQRGHDTSFSPVCRFA